MRQHLLWIGSAVLAVALTLAACGGGSDSGGGTPSSPSPTPTPMPMPTPTPGGGTTITVTSSGASPRTLTVPAGSRVTFVNNDSRAHEMNSDPHPSHTDCPELNQVGFLSAGQSRQTGNLNTVPHLRLPRPRPEHEHVAAGHDRHPVARYGRRRPSGLRASTPAWIHREPVADRPARRPTVNYTIHRCQWPVLVMYKVPFGRGIPATGVAPPSHMANMLGRCAWPAGRRAPKPASHMTRTGH